MECSDDERINDGFPDDGGETRFEFVGSFVGETDDAEVGGIDAESNKIRHPRREYSRLPLRAGTEISESGGRLLFPHTSWPGEDLQSTSHRVHDSLALLRAQRSE